MKRNRCLKWSVMLMLIFNFIMSFNIYADESIMQQEQFLENQLENATDSEQIAKITFALSNIKKQQSQVVLRKMPELVGRDRSFLSSSVRDSWNYRHIASTFKSEPVASSIAYSYKVGHFLGMCCMALAFAVLFLRARPSYRY